MRFSPIEIKPPKIRITEEEILADLAYPARPQRPRRLTGPREDGR
jgi:hypothetical protein